MRSTPDRCEWRACRASHNLTLVRRANGSHRFVWGACRYVKAMDGQEVSDKEVRGLFDPHVNIRHVSLKGHFAFVELEDAARSELLSSLSVNGRQSPV